MIASSFPLLAQWHVLHPTAPPIVTAQAFHVVAESGSDIHEYSAMAVGWRNVGTGSLEGSSDWLSLIKVGPATLRAYSARLHRHADITFAMPLQQLTPGYNFCIEDDVLMVIGPGPTGDIACAYSAQFNSWQCVDVGADRDFVCDRFVIGLRNGTQAHGFSARTGQWSAPVPCTTTATLSAGANIVLLDEGAPGTVTAFSGVRGEWSPPQAQHPSSVPMLDANVAYVRAPGGVAGFGLQCAYNAYNGVWVTGSGLAGTVHITSNVVLVEQPGVGPGMVSSFRAFGVHPGAWAALTLPAGASYTLRFGPNRDWVVVDNETADTMHGFSGLCGGSWQNRSYASSVSDFRARKVYAVGRDASGNLHAFSAPTGSWAAAVPMPGGALGTLADQGTYAFAHHGMVTAFFAARDAAWTAGPPPAPAPIYAFAGSFMSRYDSTTGNVAYWLERYDEWRTLPAPVPPVATTARNHMLLDFTPGLGFAYGVSGQRGDAVAAPIPAGTPFVMAGVSENVMCIQHAGALYAFGSANDTHSLFGYTADSEFAVVTTGGPTLPSKVMVKAPPASPAGSPVFVVIGLTPLIPCVPLPPLGACGELCVDPLLLLHAGVLGANGLLDAPFELSVTAPPGCYELWYQGVVLDPTCITAVGRVAEPALLF